MIDRYQRALFYHRRSNGHALSFRTQYLMLTWVKQFFRWLVRENHILYNPASEIELPRVERQLPKHVLTANEADRIPAQPDIATPFGLRDRAMLEVLYSTGMRRSELPESSTRSLLHQWRHFRLRVLFRGKEHAIAEVDAGNATVGSAVVPRLDRRVGTIVANLPARNRLAEELGHVALRHSFLQG